jgi:pimeloyl-ACP methyl ester carboxylesterase
MIAVAEEMPVHPDLQTAADNNLPRGASFIAGWGHGPDQHLGGNSTPGLWMIGGATAVVENSEPGILSLDLSICASYKETLEKARTAKCPTTLILGSRDKMTPRRAAQPLIDALTNPTVVELEGVGHMSMTEAPKEVRQVLVNNFSNF